MCVTKNNQPWLGWLSEWSTGCEPKGLRFDSQSGHMPGLLAKSPVGGAQEATTHRCFSPSLSLSLALSKNKLINFKKEIKRKTQHLEV